MPRGEKPSDDWLLVAGCRNRKLPVRPQLDVAADGGQVETTAARTNARLDVAAIHPTVAEREGVVAVDAAAHCRHREVDVELAREVESDVAAHRVKYEIAAAGEFLDADVDVAADRIRGHRARAQAIELEITAHAVGAHVAGRARDRDIAAHRVRRYLNIVRHRDLEVHTDVVPFTITAIVAIIVSRIRMHPAFVAI